jgi:hypothetical protein
MPKKLSLQTKKIIQEIRNDTTSGGSITLQLDSLKKTLNKNIVKPVSDYTKAIIYGRNDYPPKVRNILRTTQHIYIKSITIKRSPVPALITGALSVFSLGKFGKRVERAYDELFHLYLVITLYNNEKYLLEKNEVINMERNPKNRDNEETQEITTPIPNNLSINEMLEKTKNNIGNNKFFGYSARDNNCQDFLINILKSNNFGNENNYNFIKQNTKQLFDNMPVLRKLSNTITDLGAAVNVITTGKGVTEIHNYSDILKHLTEHIMDEKEPIDNRDYKQAIKLIKSIKDEKIKMKGGQLYINHYHHIIKGKSHNNYSSDSESSDSDDEQEYLNDYKTKYYFT